MTSHHFAIRDEEIKFPEELDLMARLAGMARFGRWAGWEHAPLIDDSTEHVSVWQKDWR